MNGRSDPVFTITILLPLLLFLIIVKVPVCPKDFIIHSRLDRDSVQRRALMLVVFDLNLLFSTIQQTQYHQGTGFHFTDTVFVLQHSRLDVKQLFVFKRYSDVIHKNTAQLDALPSFSLPCLTFAFFQLVYPPKLKYLIIYPCSPCFPQ